MEFFLNVASVDTIDRSHEVKERQLERSLFVIMEKRFVLSTYNRELALFAKMDRAFAGNIQKVA